MISKTLSLSKTRLALFWMHLANEPFVALITLSGFILKKELHATTFELSCLATLHPACSLISFFLATFCFKKEEKLVPYLMVLWVLGRVLFLFLPIYSSPSFLILSVFCYQLFTRSSAPALIEILRNNIEESKRLDLFSLVYFFSFLESVLLGLFVGKILDFHPNSWKILFACFSLLSLTSLYFQNKLPKKTKKIQVENRSFNPLKKSLSLLKQDPYFLKFQKGFMFGGFGLMMMNPALITYYSDTLHLNHQALTNCRYIWMGLGVCLSTFVWKKLLNKETIFFLSSIVIIGFSIFPLIVLRSSDYPSALFIGFILYGVAQAGSHLIWHLSGNFFARDDESSTLYTATNVLCVGIRGVIAPFLGGFFTDLVGAPMTLIIGSVVAMGGAFLMLKKTPLLASS